MSGYEEGFDAAQTEDVTSIRVQVGPWLDMVATGPRVAVALETFLKVHGGKLREEGEVSFLYLCRDWFRMREFDAHIEPCSDLNRFQKMFLNRLLKIDGKP